MRCCVPLCKNTSDNASSAEGKWKGISFHSFPSDMHLRAAWLRTLGKQDSHPPDSAVVCSQHFLYDDIYETECGLRQIATGAIPSTVQVCMICLDMDSKLILMSMHKLEEAYEKLTGHPMYDPGNLKQTLCVQCAQRLINFSRFRDKSLRARALMMDLVEKHQLITRRHIKMINRTKHQLKSSMVLTTLGPDHCDLHILEHPSEDKQTELQEIEPRDVVKTEESDDSMLVDVEVEVMKHEEDNNVNDFVQDPLKYESVSFQCTLCLEEFVHEHEYMQHLGVHFQNSDTDVERGTSQVCKPHPAVSSSSSLSSLITENKQADPSPCARAAHTTVASVSATFATTESGAEKNFKQKLGGLQNISTDSKIFTNCVVRLCDIFKELKAPKQDQALTKIRNFVSGIQNIASIDCSHQATSQNEVQTLQSKTDDIKNIQCNNSSQYSSHTAKSIFICDICGNIFKRKSFLVIHIKTHSEVRRFNCNICQYRCKFKRYLAQHMQTHAREKPFTCNICNSNFARSSRLVDHMRTHTGVKPYACELCEYRCSDKSNLVSHMRTHTGEKQFYCNICNSKFSQSSRLVAHMRTHTGVENPYACELCEYRCAWRGNLVRHKRTHTGEKPFNCNICNSKFSQSSRLVAHMRTHTGVENPYACELCEYRCAWRGNLVRHKRTHTGEKPFSCNICNSKFARSSRLVAHMRNHTGVKPYECELCEYRCARRGNLVSHKRTHTGEKPFNCNICNSKFSQSSQLVYHMRTHTGVKKPYACELCEYKSAQKRDLVRHMRTHTGEKPYNCNICNSKFSQSSLLVGHMRTHTGEKPYACELCEYRCAWRDSLVRHKRTHTPEKPFTCNICNSKFARSSQLVAHMRTHTGVKKPYACELCEYKCAQKCDLVRHMRTHTGEKPFNCNICNSKFARSSHLVYHMRTHTGVKPYACELCEYRCTRSGNLVRHKRTHWRKAI